MAEDHFRAGLTELHRYLFHSDRESLSRAVDALRSATEVASDNAGYWAALGFALDVADLPEKALGSLRRANELSPDDLEVEVYAATLLSELGPEREAMDVVESLARKGGVNLESLREDLAATGMPADARALLMNGFLHARNFLRSRLEDAMERFQQMDYPVERTRRAESERRACGRMQEELQRDLDPARVPAGLRDVTPWAIRLGLGDDVCRRMVLGDLTDRERALLRAVIHEHAASVHSWLDTFVDQPMTPEAAAFMHLLLGLEEMDATAS